MSYDDYKTDVPDDDKWDEERYEQLTLRYRDEVVQELLTCVDAYLQFGSIRQLFKLIADRL